MPLKLDIKRRLTSRSDRVKCVDLHPAEPWMLCALYNGHVHIMNYENQQLVKDFEVCDVPVRSARFVARKNWIITGSDDMQIRIFNYNTLEKVHSYEAHSDYLRCIAVHPTQPLVLTSSDDMLIKLWNWEKLWACQRVFEGHTHYVMQIVFNPKDNNTFASASLDRTVKVWQLGSNFANFTLEGHEKGVNCVDYYHGGDKPYLISGADDRLVKIWDYQNKTCVQTLEGHAQNISAVCFHPELPIVLTGSEDGTVRIWHSGTYRLETCLNYGFERVWTISSMRGTNNVALGYDEGSIIIKVGREEPAMSMDVVGGKIVWAKHSEMQQVNLKTIADSTEIKDGERLPVAVKDMGACEIYPQTISHNPNGHFVVVCGDGEYIIYTSMALRNKGFGSAQEFVWALESNEYAIRENNGTVRLFRNFKERKSFTPEYGAENIYGGYYFGVKTSSGLAFYDWETLQLVRRIEVQPRNVFWNESGSLVCLATDDSYFILGVDTAQISNALESKEGLEDDGVESAFNVLGEVSESVKTGLWVGDCFIYTNSVNRINYYVGGEIVTISHLDRTMYLLGYVPKDNRLYLGDKELNVISFSLQLSVLEYQTAVMRRDFERADLVLPTIPKEHRTRVAHFLEKQGFKAQALQVSTDADHKFDLALQIGELDIALKLAREAENAQKWSQLADVASRKNNMSLVKECMQKANDFSGLLLLSTASGDAEMLQELGATSSTQGRHNIAFLSAFLRSDVERCLEILIETNRLPEAAFFARTYMPSQMSRVVELWREELSKVNEKAGQSLADPTQYTNLFPGLGDALRVEQHLQEERTRKAPARIAGQLPLNSDRNPLEELQAAEAQRGVGQLEDKEKPAFVPQVTSSNKPAAAAAASAASEEEDDDDLDLEIDGITLDDNIDTTDVNLDEDFLSDD
ncbi:coatomer subunit beta' [Drosophila nasuta]|uniref:Coatomer subunit beta' n=1 Tax=Drosophila albomicans TaxID=7291 RepID=A0A6P8W939_DROAB|nr:coatomer subunit beta' [Drosophila albomicans]XP_060665836.1 coatomer subunit beta' [Drosophila nasuta]